MPTDFETPTPSDGGVCETLQYIDHTLVDWPNMPDVIGSKISAAVPLTSGSWNALSFSSVKHEESEQKYGGYQTTIIARVAGVTANNIEMATLLKHSRQLYQVIDANGRIRLVGTHDEPPKFQYKKIKGTTRSNQFAGLEVKIICRHRKPAPEYAPA